MIQRTVNYARQFDRSLWILSAGWFVSALGFAASIPFISIFFFKEYGMTLTEIGVFFGGLAIVRSVFQVVGGEVADRLDRRKIVVVSQAVRAVAFGVLALSIHLEWGLIGVAASLLINSICGAMFQSTANALVSDILPEDQRLDGYALTRAAGNLGWAAGPAIGGLFLATSSYAMLFVFSAVITLGSSLIIMFFFKAPTNETASEPFKLADLLAIKDDPRLLRHCLLVFGLYIVVAQLIAPFSLYAVEMVHITEGELGLLYTLNGLLVVTLQIPATRLIAHWKLTTQLAVGAILHGVGYAMVGLFIGFHSFILAITVVTFGEIIMSPSTLALTSRLAPKGRMGRYMGIFGFFVTAGWSLGPLFGGVLLDRLGHTPWMAWTAISSLALVAAIGYGWWGRVLSAAINNNTDTNQ